MRYGTNTNLSSLLDQKVDILQLMHDEDSAAYRHMGAAALGSAGRYLGEAGDLGRCEKGCDPDTSRRKRQHQ